MNSKNSKILWKELNPQGKKFVSRRSGHSCVVHENSLFYYGGYEINKGPLNSFISINLKENPLLWKEISVKNPGEAPGKLYRHRAEKLGKKMYIFGGKTHSTINQNFLFVYDFDDKTWIRDKSGDQTSPCIDSHSSTTDKSKNLIYFFGGFSNGDYKNWILAFNAESHSWIEIYKDNKSENKAPCPRSDTGLVFLNENLFVFGGCNGVSRFNDLWMFSLEKSVWQLISQHEDSSISKPLRRSGHSIVAFRDKLIVFGGIHEVTYELNDTWCFDFAKGTWTNLDEDTSHRKKNTHSNSDYSAILNKDAPNDSEKKKITKNISVEKKLVENLMIAKRATTKSPHKNIQTYKEASIVRTNDSFESTTKMLNSSAMQEKKKKVFHFKKLQMLSEFDVKRGDPQFFDLSSPTTIAMKYSINNMSLAINSPRREHKHVPGKLSGNFIEIAKGFVAQGLEMIKKPNPRDGHSTVLLDDKMIIFGGDRHLISFDDLFMCDLSSL